MYAQRKSLSGLLFTGALLALTAVGQPSLAASHQVPPVRVYYGDLDLNSQAGARLALRRLKSAAERACGKAPRLNNLRRHSAYRNCVEETTDKAVKDLRAPLVTALYERNRKYARADDQTR